MKETIHFGHMGNGVTVWDSSREVNHDYPTVAHISYERTVSYRETVSPEARRRIENFARYGNMSVSHTQPDTLALRPLSGSSFMSTEEKECFLRDYECSTDGVEPFIRQGWDDAKTPMENLSLFARWWRENGEKYMG